jgi:hypothetical protein
MRVSTIVVPHFGHGGRVIALDDACVVDDGMVLSFFRREHSQLSATDARGDRTMASDEATVAPQQND